MAYLALFLSLWGKLYAPDVFGGAVLQFSSAAFVAVACPTCLLVSLSLARNGRRFMALLRAALSALPQALSPGCVSRPVLTNGPTPGHRPAMKNGKIHAPSRAAERVELGRHIVADPAICHGKPTFKGTRIMVWQVLDDVADGRSWDFICRTRWGGLIPQAAIGEAVRLAQDVLLERYVPASRRPARKSPEPAFA